MATWDIERDAVTYLSPVVSRQDASSRARGRWGRRRRSRRRRARL